LACAFAPACFVCGALGQPASAATNAIKISPGRTRMRTTPAVLPAPPPLRYHPLVARNTGKWVAIGVLLLGVIAALAEWKFRSREPADGDVNPSSTSSPVR